MVKYLSKFVLEVLPSVVATVVGAYIVAHYINPKPDTPKAAVVATAPAGDAKDATDTTGTVDDKAGDAKSADAKSADAKSADAKSADAKSADAKSAESKSEAKSAGSKSADARPAEAETAKAASAKAEGAKVKVAKPDEKKNAIELARAAIERLRGTPADTPVAPLPQSVRAPAETARADDSAHVAAQAPAPQRTPVATPVITTGVAPQATAAVTTAPPPLPPPVIVASPYGRHSVGPEAPGAIAPTDQPDNQASADRPTPPADIPTAPADVPFQSGYGLQAQAAPVEHVSIADHVLSTTKSFFRALTPNSQSN